MQAGAVRIIAGKIESVKGFCAAVFSIRNVCITFATAHLRASAVFLASLIPLVFQFSCVPANLGMGHESA